MSIVQQPTNLTQVLQIAIENALTRITGYDFQMVLRTSFPSDHTSFLSKERMSIEHISIWSIYYI